MSTPERMWLSSDSVTSCFTCLGISQVKLCSCKCCNGVPLYNLVLAVQALKEELVVEAKEFVEANNR